MNLQNKTRIKIDEWTDKYGGLSRDIEAQIETLIAQYEKQHHINNVCPANIKGTKLIREYQGKTYSVTVCTSGYLYNNNIYRSLSAIANTITGTHCNGRKFFGVS